MHLIGAYCAIQTGAYTFGTTRLAPQMVVIMACLVTWEFDRHKKDVHFAKTPTLMHNLMIYMLLKDGVPPQRLALTRTLT